LVVEKMIDIGDRSLARFKERFAEQITLHEDDIQLALAKKTNDKHDNRMQIEQRPDDSYTKA